MKFPLALALLFVLNFVYPQDLDIELYATGLDRPVNIKHAGDDRLFVIEQEGYISIVNASGEINTTPYLDLTSRVGTINSIGDERGLLGLAFHPNYNSNGYFFVNYIDDNGDTIISRFTRDSSSPSVANENSELIILTYSQPFSNHNGGDMAFGADGYLYISSGDGGSGGDPQDNGQDTSSLLGKILRIDVNNASTEENYSIPADNPFVGSPTSRDEIWAYGLRNPWKFSFDRLNGDIWIGDVGQNQNEEINRASATEAGLNYGWRCYEGNSPFNTDECPNQSELTFPVTDYNHFTDGAFKCSITGGYRYRGISYPAFNGLYFFADYCSQEIGYLTYNSSNGLWDTTFEQFSGSWSAFGEDINGELYISDIQTGNIYKLIDNTLSVNANELSKILIYPNPTKGELTISFSKINSKSLCDIFIYNIRGEVVKSIKLNRDSVQKINTSDLSTGIYILKMNIENSKESVHKLIIL